MLFETVFAKTAKGHEEIEKRSHGLPQGLRQLLILIDGRVTFGELTARNPSIGDINAKLDALIEQGYVTVATPGTAAPTPASHPGVLQNDLIALAREVLGKDADRVVVRLTGAGNSAESLRLAAVAATKFIRLTIDESKADEFARRAGALIHPR